MQETVQDYLAMVDIKTNVVYAVFIMNSAAAYIL